MSEDRKRRRFRRIARAGTVAACLIGAGLLVAALFLPRFVTMLVERELRAREIDSVRFRLPALGRREAVVGPLVVGHAEDALSVEAVTAEYDLGELRRGRLRELRIVGLRATVVQEDGTWRLSGVSELLKQLGRSNKPSPPEGTSVPLRCDRILVRGAELALVSGERRWTVPAEVEATMGDPTACRFTARLRPFGEPLEFTGELNLETGSGTVAVENSALEPAHWLALAPLLGALTGVEMPELHGHFGMKAQVTMAGHAVDHVSLVLTTAGLLVRTAQGSVRLSDVEAKASIDPGGPEQVRWTVQGVLTRIAAAGVECERLPFRVTGTEQGAEWITEEFALRWRQSTGGVEDRIVHVTAEPWTGSVEMPDKGGEPRWRAAGRFAEIASRQGAIRDVELTAESRRNGLSASLHMASMAATAGLTARGHVAVDVQGVSTASPTFEAKIRFEDLCWREMPIGELRCTATGSRAALNWEAALDAGKSSLGIAEAAMSGSLGVTPALTAEFSGRIQPDPEAVARRMPGIQLSDAPPPIPFNGRLDAEEGGGLKYALEARLPKQAFELTAGTDRRVKSTVELTARLSGTLEAAVLGIHAVLRNLTLQNAEHSARLAEMEADLAADLDLRAAPPAGRVRDVRAVVQLPEQEIRLAGPDQRTARANTSGSVQARFGEDQTAHVRAVAEFANVELTQPGWSGAAVTLTASLDALGPRGLPVDGTGKSKRRDWQSTGQIRLTGGAVRTADSLEATGLSAGIAFAWHGLASGFVSKQDAPRSEVTIERVAAAGMELGELAAGIRLEGHGLAFEGGGIIQGPEAPVTFKGTLGWARGLHYTAYMEVPELILAAGDTWYRRLPGMADLTLAGGVRGTCTVRGSGGGAPQLTAGIGLSGLDVAVGDKVSVAGIEAELAFASLIPPATAAHQKLRFRSARLGGVPLDGGAVVFQLEGPHALFLESCELQWLGGRIQTHAVRFDPARPEFDVQLFADGVDVARVLSLFQGVPVQATGSLYGQIPLSIRKGSVRYDNGFLYSVPGETGRLQVGDEGLLTGALPPQHPNYDKLVLAEETLRDMTYSLFKLDFAGEGTQDTRLRLRLKGDPTIKGVGAPVDLTVNINGALQQFIDAGLRIGGF